MDPVIADPTIDETSGAAVNHLDRQQRVWALAIGGGLLGLLAVARWLSPSPNGMGTHQQLGLPPCTSISLFGIPCPTCGMTTSWSHLMHGNWAESWSANSGGTCLAVVAAIVGGWALVTSIRGKYTRLLPMKVVGAIGIGITAVTLLDWMGRIF